MSLESWISIEMAKRNVQSLLDKIIAESQKDSKVRAEVNKKVHVYTVDLKTLWKEVVDQLEGKYARKGGQRLSLSPEEVKQIKKASIDYFNNIKKEVYTESSGAFKVDTLFSGPTSFRVRIESVSGNASVFRNFISKVRREPLKQLRKQVYETLRDSGKMNAEVRSRVFGTSQTSGGLLDPGHAIGTSITENRIGSYILDLEAMAKSSSRRSTKGTNPLMDVVAAVKNNPRLDHLKSINFSVVYVGEQGVDHNRNAQAVQEQILINSLRKQIKQAVETTDWGNFRTSSSGNEMISSRLIQTAKKRGAKVSNNKKLDLKNTKAKGTIKQTLEVSGTNDRGVNISTKEKSFESSTSEARNWSSLLPIINTKLTPRVMSNMKFPSLVNRTGTFAGSAKVVAVETTREGFPSFVYNYERDPYDVFDRTLGRAPWNTPERDPKAIIDKSLREILRELAIGRFYTRRA